MVSPGLMVMTSPPRAGARPGRSVTRLWPNISLEPGTGIRLTSSAPKPSR